MDLSQIGQNVNLAFDKLGFPDKVGDAIGLQIDMAVGNQLGIAKGIADLLLPVTTSQLDKLMGQGFAQPGFCPRPHIGFPHHFGLGKHTFYDKESISVMPEKGIAGWLGHKQVNIDGNKINLPPGFDTKGLTPQKFEAKLWSDPALRRALKNNWADGSYVI